MDFLAQVAPLSGYLAEIGLGLALALIWLTLDLRRRRRAARVWVVLDGSNVMHWHEGTPKIETVIEVIRTLEARGFTAGVVFDANAGYKVLGRYLGDNDLARRLKLPPDRVLVVGRGTPADPVILQAARDLGARIVTNDRYADWAGDHPELRQPGHLIRGGYRSGRLWLDLPG